MATDVSNKNAENVQNMEQCYENLIVIDIGANLTNKKYSRDLDSVVQRAKDAGVQKIMVTGTSVKTSKEALRLTRIYPGTLYSTAGIHPHDAKSYTDESWLELRAVAGNPECVAVGECGLDYNRNFSEPEEQRRVFHKQIELACELKKPLFVHEREAHIDLLEILDHYKGRLPAVVIHCFTGTTEQALNYLDKGFYIGLTGYLCKDKSDTGVRKLLIDGTIPLDRLLVETDSPFMYPNTRASKLPLHVKDGLTESKVIGVDRRADSVTTVRATVHDDPNIKLKTSTIGNSVAGKTRSMTFLHRYCTFQRNEPCSLPAIVEMIAAFMNKKPEEVALATAFNALKLFGLSQ